MLGQILAACLHPLRNLFLGEASLLENPVPGLHWTGSPCDYIQRSYKNSPTKRSHSGYFWPAVKYPLLLSAFCPSGVSGQSLFLGILLGLADDFLRDRFVLLLRHYEWCFLMLSWSWSSWMSCFNKDIKLHDMYFFLIDWMSIFSL